MIDTSITVIYHAMSVTVLYIFKQTIPDDPDPNEADSKGMPDDQEPVKYMSKIPREADFLTYTSNQHG
jgi:hypothetical protein